MATIDPVVVQIQADISNLKNGLAQAQTSLKGLEGSAQTAGGKFDAFGGTLKKVGAVLGTVFAATQVYKFFADSVKGAMEAESALTRLSSILLTTGGATEVQIAALEKQAEALSKVGFASKDNIITTQAQLATFDLQGKTIQTLTPAILDYVAAEKGATASTEDYKQMTNGLAQALQGNFAALTRVGFVLDEDTKKKISNGTEAQRAAAITEVLNSTYKDFNKTLAETPEGRMIKLKQEFDDLKQTIGEALLPVLTQLMGFMNSTVFPVLKKAADAFKAITTKLVGSGSLGDGFGKLKDEAIAFFKPFVEIIKTVAGPGSFAERLEQAGKIAKDFFVPILIAVKDAVMKVRQAILDNKERIVGWLTTVKEVFTWGMKYLVPFFKTVLVAAVKSAATGISAAIKIIIPVVEFVANAIKTLMNVAIKGINLLITGYNKAAKVLGKDTIPTLDEIGKKTEDFSVKMGRVSAAAKKAGKDVKDAFGGDPFAGAGDGGKGGGKGDKKTQAKIDALKNKINGYLKDWKNAQKDAQEKYSEAEADFYDRVNEANKRYLERKADLEERNREQLAEAEARHKEQVAEANKRWTKRDEELRKANAKRILEINKEYDKKELELKNRLADQKEQIEKASTQKIADLRAKAAEKEASILQQSIDRLRSAFASGLGVNLKEEFEKGGGITGIIEALRDKLIGAKELQKNAGLLAAKGYSQTFIEQIVSQGPKVGNEMAKAILEAKPETTKEIQALFGEMEIISETGLNALGETMNRGGNLATSELRQAYRQVAADLATSLAEVNSEMKARLAEAQEAYDLAVTENAKARDEALLEAAEALKEALAENDAQLKEALAEADADLKKAQEEAAKDLAKGLADAQKDLQDAITESQKAFEKAIDAINKSMQKKLDDLLEKIKAAQSALAKLGSTTFVPTPSYTPYSPTAPAIPPSVNNNLVTNNNISLTQNTQTDPTTTLDTIINGIKFGNVIVPTVSQNLQGESGAIGAAYAYRNARSSGPISASLRSRGID